jgi:ABC-type phosphate transport system permease subunit
MVIDVELQQLSGAAAAMSLWSALSMLLGLIAAIFAARYGGRARRHA